MPNGQYRTFDEFGWNSSQAPSIQHANVQSALNSGEPLLRPVGEDVTIDGPLLMNYTTSLIGTGASVFVQTNLSQDILRVQADKCLVQGGHFNRVAPGSGSGIVIGPNNGDHCRWVRIQDVHTSGYSDVGMHVRATGDLQVRGCNISGNSSGVLWENTVNSDAGDNKFIGNDVNASPTNGAGFRHRSGGGMYATLNKFGSGYNHVKYEWHYGSSGVCHWVNNGFESCQHISFDMDGTVPFDDLLLASNRFAGPSVAFAIRNFHAIPWIKNVMIIGNEIQAGSPSNVPCIDLGSVSKVLIEANIINGGGVGAGMAHCGIIVRPQASEVGIGGGNRIRDCATPVINMGPSTTIQPML